MNKTFAIRGAITVEENSRQEIKEGTLTLLEEILKSNSFINKKDIVSLIISSTVDIDVCYPATFITECKVLEGVPLFSTVEPNIKNSLPFCIRFLLTINCEANQKVNHVYLKNAKNLGINTKN